MLTRLLIVVLVAVTGVARSAATDEPLRVTVSIEPQAWIVEELLGDGARIQVLLPPRAGHLAFDPRPRDMVALSRADVIVRSGLPFESALWTRIQGSNPDAIVVESPADEDHHGHSHHDHHDDHEDPHFWLDPVQMEMHAADIADVLSGVSGVDGEVVQANFERLESELHALDQELAEILRDSRGEEIWSFHASWGPFAHHYGLTSRSIETDGKAPGVKGMLALMDSIEDSGATVIFTEPGLDPRQVAAIETSTRLKVVELDPMRRDYPENLRAVASAIVGALE